MSLLEQIQDFCVGQLRGEKAGLRYSELVRLSTQKFRDAKPGNIRGAVWDLHLTRPDQVYKQARGVFRHTNFNDSQLGETGEPNKGSETASGGQEAVGTAVSKGGVEDEDDLYPPLKKWFDETWGADSPALEFYACVITASPRGHKRNSGKWSRPDLSIVMVTSAEFFVPSKELEVTTVEVKRNPDISSAAVLETASHSKFAHQSYLAVEWLDTIDIDKSSASDVSATLKEARRFGVGILQIRVMDGECSVREILEPKRHAPDPSDCSDFIRSQFEKHHKQIRNAIK